MIATQNATLLPLVANVLAAMPPAELDSAPFLYLNLVANGVPEAAAADVAAAAATSAPATPANAAFVAALAISRGGEPLPSRRNRKRRISTRVLIAAAGLTFAALLLRSSARKVIGARPRSHQLLFLLIR